MTSVVNCRHEPYDVYIGRGSPYGNPYTHLKGKTMAKFQVATRDEAVDSYMSYITSEPDLMALLPALRGKRLGCWCSPKRCHGEVIVHLLDVFTDTALLSWHPSLVTMLEAHDKVVAEQQLLWEPDGRI